MDFEIVKAGWLHRQSSVLKRWKRSWFVLYTDGILRFFESHNSTQAEEAFRIRPECVAIRTGRQVQATPPEGYSIDCLLEVDFTTGKKLILCTDTFDDQCAWKLSIEDVRIVHRAPERPMTAPPPGYTHTVYQVPPGSNVVYTNTYGSQPPSYVVQNPDGTQTTVIVDDRYPQYHRRGYGSGRMMWGPVLFW